MYIKKLVVNVFLRILHFINKRKKYDTELIVTFCDGNKIFEIEVHRNMHDEIE